MKRESVGRGLEFFVEFFERGWINHLFVAIEPEGDGLTFF